MKRILASLALAAGIAAHSPAFAQSLADDHSPVDASVAGASAQGMFAVAGEALNEMVRREYPDSSITYEPGSTAGSLALMLNGEKPLSIAHSAIDIEAALNGTAPFTEAYPADDLKLIARITGNMHPYVVARKDFVEKTGVKSFDDILAQKIPMRISLNQKGTLPNYHQVLALFDFHHVSEDDLVKAGSDLEYVPTNQGIEMLTDNKLDLVFLTSFTPASAVSQLLQRGDMVLLPISKEGIDFIAERFKLKTETIPAGTYQGQDFDMPVTSLPLFLSAGPAADDHTVYAVAKSIVNQFTYYQSVHPQFKEMTLERMVDVAPYTMHPAAKQAYEEAGLLK